MKRCLLRCSVLGLVLPSWLLLTGGFRPLTAQEQGPLNTDRPGFGTGTATVGRFQNEGGYSLSEAGDVETHSLGEVLLRVPVVPRLEVRLGVNSYLIRNTPGSSESGLADASIGAKLHLADAAERFDLLRPDLAVVVNTTLPTGSDALGAPQLQPGALLTAAWPLAERWGLASDVNLTWLDDGDGRSAQIAGGASLSYSLAEKLGSYLEVYSFAAEEIPTQNYVDGGFTYLLSDDLQLDVSGGIGLSAAADDYFLGVGLSRRW